jgi:hypothetical protein
LARSTSGNYELRFAGLFNRGRGFAFPCDAEGHVDVDGLSEQGRSNYIHAQAVVGQELSRPVVVVVGDLVHGSPERPSGSA